MVSIRDIEAVILKNGPVQVIPLSQLQAVSVTPHSVYTGLQLGALRSKLQPENSADLDKAAWQKFLQSETRCRITTRRLEWFSKHPSRHPLMALVPRIQGIIRDTIGEEIHPHVLADIFSGMRHGPGTAIGLHNPHRCSPASKTIDCDLTYTSGARWYVKKAVSLDVHWRAEFFGSSHKKSYEVNASRIVFVPKNAKTSRTIAIEPSGNIFCQLGVHEFFAKRLKTRLGVDIHDQSHSRTSALYASCLGGDATLDLSSASDSVSVGVVKLLFPREWVALLDDLRVPNYTCQFGDGMFSKWSSMGNGYTFALETLIFKAITQAAIEYAGSKCQSTVYGDDIIVPQHAALFVIEALKFFGFHTNNDKTFIFGEFRESCGMYAYKRSDVSPCFLKDSKCLHDIPRHDFNRLINTCRDQHLGIYAYLRRNPDRKSVV